MIADRRLGGRTVNKIKRKPDIASASPKSLRLMLLLLWCFTLFGLIAPSTVATAASEALVLCGTRLIPSLFPLAAAGSVLAQASGSGRERRNNTLLGRVFRWMGLSPASAICLLMGLFAGFPVGAIIASSLAESGRIDSEEASRLCCFTNNASAAFLVGSVGNGLFGDSRIGWLLWAAQSMAALTVGVMMGRRAVKRAAPSSVDRAVSVEALPHAPVGWGTVSRAIASSAQGMLTLAAFVVFFSAFTAFLQAGIDAATRMIGEGTAISPMMRAIVNGFFEISGGMVRAASSTIPTFPKILLASAITGWSGLSVYMQVLAAAKGLSEAQTAALPRRLVKAKAASALLSTVYAAVLYGVV